MVGEKVGHFQTSYRSTVPVPQRGEKINYPRKACMISTVDEPCPSPARTVASN
jgi:hypothetical protein